MFPLWQVFFIESIDTINRIPLKWTVILLHKVMTNEMNILDAVKNKTHLVYAIEIVFLLNALKKSLLFL